jgi:hypothetical protein
MTRCAAVLMRRGNTAPNTRLKFERAVSKCGSLMCISHARGQSCCGTAAFPHVKGAPYQEQRIHVRTILSIFIYLFIYSFFLKISQPNLQILWCTVKAAGDLPGRWPLNLGLTPVEPATCLKQNFNACREISIHLVGNVQTRYL